MAMATAGRNVGPYRVLGNLGSGGMGDVVLAHDDTLDRKIAIKVLPAHLADEEEHLRRLEHEARTASSLNHPNIITIYQIGRDGQDPFIAMEFVDGQTLREVLAAGAMPPRKVVQVAAQIADGLAAAHKRGLVHRDLKPENLMITRDGVVKILDFGLAKSLSPSSADFESQPGTLVGTFGYMSPEQTRGGEADFRSDQFALGAILYEMLAGRRAFEGDSAIETLFLIARDEPAPLAAIASHVPAALRWIVDRCLAKDPEERYASTQDLARDLQHLRDHFAETAVAAPMEGGSVPAGRRATRWALLAMLVAGMLAGALLALMLRKPAPRPISSERYLTYSGHDFAPAVSSDGKLIAFSSSRGGISRIWLKQVGGGGEVALTSGGDDFARFSPDGSTVLFVHTEPDTRRTSLLRVPIVGGGTRKVLDDVTSADLSADGTKLAFTRTVQEKSGARGALFVANADGSEGRELTRSDVGMLHPRWSPDGNSVAVVISRGGRILKAVLIVDVGSGKARQLSAPVKAGEVSSVVWSADNRNVLYLRAQSVDAIVGSPAHIIRHDVQKDVVEIVRWTPHNGIMLDVLGDGKLVYDVRSPRDNLRTIQLDTAGTGTQPEQWLTRGNSSDRQPVYAPDGRAVLFSSNRSGNLDLWMTATDTGTVQRVTDDDAEDWDPAFTPDGRRIVWSSGRSGNLEIWIANADGSDAQQVSRDGVDAENPTVTADGQWIVYTSFNPQKAGIWRVRLDGSQATHLVKARISIPEVSPDGQYVSYLLGTRTAEPEIRVARVSDGADMGVSIPVANVRRTSAILGRSRWMPSGRAIAYLGQNEEGVNGIFVQDFTPGSDAPAAPRPLGGFDRERATESFGVSPDGKALTVAGWEQLFSLFMVDGVEGVTRKGEGIAR